MKKHEYFTKKYLDILRAHITSHPDDISKNIGVVFDPVNDTVWVGNFNNTPMCSVCNNKMSEGNIINYNGLCSFPYFFCDVYNCKGKEERINRHKEESLAWIEKFQDENEMSEVYKTMGIPKANYEMTISNLDFSKKQICLTSAKNKESLYIFGDTGRGKTHLATAILIDLGRYSPHNHHIVNVPELFMNIQSDIRTGADYSAKIKDLINYNLLVIDDIGSTKNTEHKKDVIFTIINSRGLENKQTIITANLTLDDIKVEYDERLASRLSEYKQIKMVGKDRRGN